MFIQIYSWRYLNHPSPPSLPPHINLFTFFSSIFSAVGFVLQQTSLDEITLFFTELFTRRDINMLAVESTLDVIAFKKKMECGYARNPFSSEAIKASSNKDVLQHLNKRPFIQGANRVRELPHGRGTLKSATGKLIYSGDWCRGTKHFFFYFIGQK